MRAPLLYAFLLAGAVANGQWIYTVAGLPPTHRAEIDGTQALNAHLRAVYGLLLDRATGRLLVHDELMVARVEPDGTLLALAGAGNFTDGDIVDGTPASNLHIDILRGMAQDASGALYLADAVRARVFRVNRDGIVTTFAGGGILGPGMASDGGPATAAGVYSPRGMVFDSKGNLYIAEVSCHCIRQVTPAGIISTVYTLPETPFTYFEGLTIDSQDDLFATEFRGHQVLKIAADGTVTIIAGTGVGGFSGDGGPAIAAQLQGPSGIALAPDGTLFIADTTNHRIRKITPDGMISTIAGTGTRGFSGDGGPSTDAQLSQPAQVLINPDGSLYVSDYANSRVRKISADGMITTIVGGGTPSPPANPNAAIGDGGPAIHAVLNQVPAAVFDAGGNLFVAELQGLRVRKIAPDGTITTVAGTGNRGYTGDGGPAIKADIGPPYSITVDSQGALYIASADSRVRKVDPGGTITLIAGTGTGNGLVRSQGDGGPAVNATLNEPKGVAVDAAGNVYIADTSNARLRMVDRNGIIRTVAGPGTLGTDYWNAVAISPNGNIFVAITHSEVTRGWTVIDRVNSDGSLTTVAGNGQPCSGQPNLQFTYDGQLAANVPLCVIIGMTFDPAGNLYIPESRYGSVLKMTPDGAISRVAGTITARTLGDAGSPLAASLPGAGYYSPAGVAIDAAGNLFIPHANRIRKVTATPLVLRLSRDRLDLQGGVAQPVAQPQVIAVTTNFAEPFPYLVRIRTDDGAGWLSANRSSGQTGEALAVRADPSGLAAGVYHATVTVMLSVPNPLTVDLPVSLTVQ